MHIYLITQTPEKEVKASSTHELDLSVDGRFPFSARRFELKAAPVRLHDAARRCGPRLVTAYGLFNAAYGLASLLGVR